ncbi:hypothetical protein [Craterilacuibacter sinensis]|uniref:Uncharacterized protein n=1 Tax=Craterilacuibacter sinensis TaxID=2686017 RepID=A0A845BRX1_9NEIS|nr:hypothetical protein [Craterilacuibacter sinensis]MXR37241.1 hypothetical protein [Craterilacuibacter sinensis]
MGIRDIERSMGPLECAAIEMLHPSSERLYRRLRRLVDRESGMVGNRPDNQASYAMLAQFARWDPPQGSKRSPWLATRRQTECAVDEMVRCGLVERVQLPDMQMRLCLRFPLVLQDSCALFDDRVMNVPLESTDERVSPSPAPQVFAMPERAVEAVLEGQDDRAISSHLDRDEMNARATPFDEHWATADDVVSLSTSGLAAADAVAVLRQQLAKHNMVPDGRFMRAVQPLITICQQRPVSRTEILCAFDDALTRKVGNTTAYAVKIIESGSLIELPSCATRTSSRAGSSRHSPAGGRGRVSAVESFMQEAWQ